MSKLLSAKALVDEACVMDDKEVISLGLDGMFKNEQLLYLKESLTHRNINSATKFGYLDGFLENYAYRGVEESDAME